MFIGHYAPALIAAASPRSQRLGTLFVAAQLVDIAFFGFVLLGVENMREVPGFTAMNAMDLYHMPYTHSLIGALAFAAAWAIATRLAGKDWPAAWIGAAVVASHWLLDLLVHAPDLTIMGGSMRYGFGLWNDPLIEMPLELGITALAMVYFVSRTKPRGWQGNASAAVLTLAMLGVQLINWLGPQSAVVRDPVPASVPIVALGAYAVLALIAGWVAATREG